MPAPAPARDTNGRLSLETAQAETSLVSVHEMMALDRRI
jgi:hypothetical protein